jgi:hypothetical protein
VSARRSVSQWHPPPSHEQLPEEQSEKLQLAPVSHWNEQLPLEHDTLHVEPAAQAVSQCPEEQSMVQEPPGGQDVLQ